MDYDFPYIGNFIIPTDEVICFPYIGNFIIPTDEVIFFSEG